MKSVILRAFGRSSRAPPWDNEKSIREELFSIERLEQHAESLAAAQSVTARPVAGRSLAVRLRDNESVLLEAYRAIADAIGEGRSITPAAEWLLDNYHLVEEQIREIRDDLPPGYYRQLPKLATGPFAGYPRVFGVAWAFVAHTDSRFDPEMLRRFVRAYQRVQPLSIGELWAVAITLRIVLVENLRRGARRIVASRAAREEADALADRLLGVNGRPGMPMRSVLQHYEQAPLPGSFAVQLVQRLRDQDPKVTRALTWLEERLAAQGTTADEIVHDEHQSQGATNVTVRNIITSMRLISDVDWTELFESVSLVDDTLRSGSDFAAMDFPTRNLYRSAIEELARGSKLTELEIARAALLATSAGGPDARSREPGYHLIAGGRRAFEATLAYRAPLLSWPGRFNATIGIGGYIGGVIAVAALVLFLPLHALAGAGIGGAWLGLLALLGLIPAIDAAMALVNRGVTREFGATILPGLELRDGIPSNLRTVLAVPILLTTPAALEEHIERLEIHHLASPEDELHFALLSDWTDATTETVDGDDALLDAAAAGIARLNRRYGAAAGGDRFLLFHRRRVWNEGQQRWIGWERKRGKLHELNRLLRGAADTHFIGAGGPPFTPPSAPPAGVRYVITLDADTRMPRETARRLVGKMAHALNRPRFDAVTRRVVEGYGVLQPRVTPSLPIGREGSLFQRIFSSMSGIDPYSSAVSDVYQDLFGEGSYTGKGIYDVDAFEAALDGRVRDSTLLSHDLFEGTFARAGLVSDIEVVEEFPSRYDVAAARQHRWARGDWQLLPWILGRGEDAVHDRAIAMLPLIGRWKMLDNLRRSLSAPASVAALLAGWALPLQAALVWTGFILSTIALSTLLPVLAAIVPRRARVTARSHLRALAADVRLALSQTVLLVVFLAYQAWLMADAIVRTLFRLLVSRRHLLDWVTAAQAQVSPRLDLAGFYRQMNGGVAAAIAAAAVAWWVGSDAWPVAAPFVIAWIASPAVARWMSLSPLVAGRLPVSDEDARALRLVARRTWRYFETFVTAEDHMLPPDNFQEDPRPVVAHRTSPTNLGVYLLAAVSARDFGWAGTTATVDRLEATLAAMDRLQRFRGHFCNWYGTRDLRPLDPQYISSVDSGNLAGHLIALANACREWAGRPVASPELFAGIDDALQLTRESLQGLPDDRRTQTITRQQLGDALDVLAAALYRAPVPPEDIGARLAEAAPHAATMADIARALASERGDDAGAEMLYWAEATLASIESHRRDVTRTADAARSLERRLAMLAATARAMAGAMEFGFLLDPDRKLLAIGYRVADGSLDPSCYDLLASEARLASFVAIAKGDVASRHWFRLGRAVTPLGRGAALVSWSGSMFEYLMPSLVMRAPAGSLLEETSRLVVRRQVNYGATLDVPWGISESGYNVRDLEHTYQYSNFGVPGLGLKRGLGENAVVAPYATALAAMVDPGAAARNFARLAAIGARGRYGFYEALDYTPARLPEGKNVAVVRAYMAHHQGMTVVAIANALLDGKMRARFHAEPMVQATELLLQERTPRDVALAHPRAEEVRTAATVRDLELPAVRRLSSAHDATPEAHLLSNGRYAVMLTGAGSGYSRWGNLGITRWREDVTRDDWGAYVFLRDVDSGDVWSAGYQPSGVEPDSYEVTFTEDRAEYVRHDGTITTVLDVVVSPEANAEVRRVSVVNAGDSARDIELTSYSELVLAPPAADMAHPVFSKLFVQTEYLARIGAILATRRRRSPGEPEIWAAHLAVVEGEAVGEPEIETDRARFLGRGRDVRAPIAVMDGRPLSNTVGTVLDPVFALRRRVRVPPGRTVRIAFWTVVASSRSEVLDLIDKHEDTTAFDRAATLAWTQAQVQLSYLGIDAEQAGLFQRLAGHVLYADPALRPSSDAIRRGGGAPVALWAQGISGDLPIILVRIDDIEDVAIVRQLLRAHEYWRMKQLAVDLVILNERAPSYVHDLQTALETLVRTSQSRQQTAADVAGGAVFVLRTDLIPAETRARLLAMSRAVLIGRRGTLAEQLNRLQGTDTAAPPEKYAPPRRVPHADVSQAVPVPQNLEFFNGLGGFAADGREYVTTLGPGRSLPAPWINVIANPAFGFQVAVEGGGYTWSLSSRENQLTPWSNDPVTDRPGEIIYLRDEESGALWGPTVLPIRDEPASYIARHGQGYSRFEHSAHGIALDLMQYVPLDDPIKISRLTIRNTSGRPRRLSVTAYVEWVLGPSRSASALSVVTELDPETGAMLARNPWNLAYGSRVAFADLGGRQTAWTGDRREFLGRNGTLDNPAALAGETVLSQTVGAGLDPCGALQTPVELEPGDTVEIVFFLGEAATAADAQSLIARYRAADLDAVLREVTGYWDDVLGTVQVTTPDRSMDLMLNRWLLYQTLACRMWARAAFYQAGGAYGFRDQLQDGMALALSRPALTREHLLRAAARQFVEGDVQHWWLPHSGQGVRTRVADDRIWLACAAAHYIETTGDTAVLEEPVPFLEGQVLRPGEHDAYFQPMVADESATLFEHCARGLDQSLGVGKHGLPLIGTGDWNDGMNRVGAMGKGESVWLGWFLHATLAAFAPFATARGLQSRAMKWTAHAAALRNALEQDGWDGGWYRRGFFDDGTPLGSSASAECRIDSIAQSWSVISGAADPARAARAMAAVDELLISGDEGLALLFTPPFDRTPLDPGYIKGYPPGIRENGGQYNHAATWSVIAFAALGQGDKSAEVFSLMNPISRTSTRADVQRYKVEPYAVAADVYSVAPHAGRGGWTWYTGTAGCLYRAGIEAILGFRRQGAFLLLAPCIPREWPRFEIAYKYRSARYEIAVENPRGVNRGVSYAELDGKPLAGGPARVPLVDDGLAHQVRVILG
ncbi:MAG: glycosyl transferase [Betaproteobacteria bacterium RIFCSPLOWO2_02_FULL_67_26]|nr:MAG: glycosyl transferase [Betaproteobacteria bacterium RIFCSPLOWO2_02_FULL_67_26]